MEDNANSVSIPKPVSGSWVIGACSLSCSISNATFFQLAVCQSHAQQAAATTLCRTRLRSFSVLNHAVFG